MITLGEQDFLEQAASRKDFPLRILPPHNPVALKMRELCAGGNFSGLLFRLRLLQFFVEAFGNELEQAASHWETADARERLRVLLERTPSAELLEMSFGELARQTHCTSRHLSRLFRELVGMSFRDKRAELRLTRARDLLATSRSKVVEVALESGYKSLSLFNLMFTRHFGTSPGRWRQKHREQRRKQRHSEQKSPALCSLEGTAGWFFKSSCLNPPAGGRSAGGPLLDEGGPPENILSNQIIRLFQNCRNSDTRQSHPAFNF